MSAYRHPDEERDDMADLERGEEQREQDRFDRLQDHAPAPDFARLARQAHAQIVRAEEQLAEARRLFEEFNNEKGRAV